MLPPLDKFYLFPQSITVKYLMSMNKKHTDREDDMLTAILLKIKNIFLLFLNKLKPKPGPDLISEEDPVDEKKEFYIEFNLDGIYKINALNKNKTLNKLQNLFKEISEDSKAVHLSGSINLVSEESLIFPLNGDDLGLDN
jgi:hypothetical protein